MIDLKSLKYPENFFEGEERHGFYVSGMMKRLWATQMDILYWIDEVCKKYNIHYILCYGSMLGAVRHGGYIPWDDDMDIAMLRNDYTRFMEAVTIELPTYLSTKSLLPGAIEPKEMIFNIGNGTSIDTSPEFLGRFHGCPYATGVDIFVYDRVPEDTEQYEYQDRMIRLLDRMLMLQWEIDDGSISGERRCEYEEIKKTLETELDFRFAEEKNKPIQILRLLDLACSLCEDCGSKHVEHREEAIYYKEKDILDEYFIDIIRVPFEGVIDVPIPCEYDAFLRKLFGDYNEIKMFSSDHKYPIYYNQREELYRQYLKRGWKIPEEFLEDDKGANY